MYFNDVLARIEQADDFEISEIIDAVVRRYSVCFPDWEVVFLSFHKDPLLKKAELEASFDFLMRKG